MKYTRYNLNKLLKETAFNADLNYTILFDEILKAWQGLGQNLQNNATPISLKKGCLFIRVNNIIWLKQLAKLKKDIIHELNRYFNKELIKKVELFSE